MYHTTVYCIRRASIVWLVRQVRPWMDDPNDEGCRHPCGHRGVDRWMDGMEDVLRKVVD